MSWDTVPWFVGGGAEHSPEVARLLAYAATSGAEGIVTPGDLKVAALGVPGPSVTVAPGAGLILNRAAGGTAQSYVARLPDADTVEIAPTASTKRSDLIVVQIEDPFMAGEPWQDPEDPKVGPYVFTRVIPNVPATATRLQDVPGYSGRSAITLARVDVPASTGTITAAMITDLRKVARPRKDRQVRAHAQTGSGEALRATAQVGEVWPNTGSFTVDVPTWATKAIVIATWSQVQAKADANGSAYGRLWVQLGNDGDANTRLSQESSWDTPDVAKGSSRNTYTVVDELPIYSALRGKTVPIKMRGRRSDTTTSAEGLVVDAVSGVSVDVEFIEAAA